MPQTQTATRAAGDAWPFDRFETTKQCVGYRVRDPRGRKIGRLKRLYLNERGGPEYAEVKVGFFGLRTVLIPLLTVTADAERRILVLE
jgi:PRC-barrel domain